MSSSLYLVPTSSIVSALIHGSMSAARYAVHYAAFHPLPSSSPMNFSSGSLLSISDSFLFFFTGDQTPFLLV